MNVKQIMCMRLFLSLLSIVLFAETEIRAQSDPPRAATEEAVTDSVRRWLASNAIRLSTVEAESGFDDMQELKDVVGDARLVLLGEPTHGNREVYQLKHRMVEFFVEEMDFDVLAMETPMPESFDVHEYVATGMGDPEKALAATHVWPWDTEEVAEALAWMRRYNAEPANTRKLKFYGFDMQSPERAANFTLDYLDRVDSALAAAAREKLGHLAIPFSDPEAVGYRPIVGRDSDARVQEALDVVLAAFDEKQEAWVAATSADGWAVARQHARVLGQWVEANRDGARRYGVVRDSSMAENIRWILEREGPDAKVVVWAHNSHLANAKAPASWGGYLFAGHHLRRMFGDEVMIFGFLFNQGGFRAKEVAVPSRGLLSFEVGPAPEGTLEVMLSNAGLRLAAVDLRCLPDQGPVAEWFSAPRATRHSGGGYDVDAPDRYFLEYVAPEAFDALVFVDSTTSMRPIEPADYGAFPVLTAPINLDFEHGLVGETPEGWIVWSKLRRFGFEIVTSDERPYRGSRAAMIRRQPGRHFGEVSGSLIQRIDASPYRGKRIRLRAAARAELAGDGVAFLRLRVHPPHTGSAHDDPAPIFDSLDEHRVTSLDWRVKEIVADVPEDAGIISYGLFLAGSGSAWVDAVSVEAVKE